MNENSKKVIVIGDGYVGKTCLVSKITEGKFINNYHTTIGVEYGVKVFKRPGSDIRLCLWDIAGQDPFRSLMPQFGRNSAAAIVMCDVTRSNTLEGARVWKQSVDTSVFLPNGQHIPCILLVNKYDCPKSHRQITPEEVEVFVKDNGFIKHFETSVKDGTNVSEALDYLVDVIVSFEETGQVMAPCYDDGIALTRTYSQSKKTHYTCCG